MEPRLRGRNTKQPASLFFFLSFSLSLSLFLSRYQAFLFTGMGSRGRRVMILFRLVLGIYAIGDSDKPRKGERERERERERGRERGKRNLPGSATLSLPLSVPSDRLGRGGEEGGGRGYTFISSSGNAQLAYLLWSPDCFISSPTFRTLLPRAPGSPPPPPPSFFPSKPPKRRGLSLFPRRIPRIFLCESRISHGNLEIVTRQSRGWRRRRENFAEIFRRIFFFSSPTPLLLRSLERV